VAVACALPKVEIDESLGSGASGGTGSGGSGAKGGTGPLGDGGEFSSDARELKCSDYCETYLENCLDSEANTYDDLDDCVITCFTSNWPFGPDEGEANSLQCRVVHAHLAAAYPNPHCFHSAEVPSLTTCALR
jgi:hypothetical protein